MPVSQVISFVSPLLTVAAAISPVMVSGYFARRAAVRAGFYGQGR